MKQHTLMLVAALVLTATAAFAADGAMMEKPMDKDMPVSNTMMKGDDGMMMKKDMPMDTKMDKNMMHKDGMMKKDKMMMKTMSDKMDMKSGN